MSILSPALAIPDSLLAREATGILREHSGDLLFNHSVRVYLFAAEQGRQRKLRFDAELLYIAAAFHDLGLTRKFSNENNRFEVDGDNAARQFLARTTSRKQVQPSGKCRLATPGITPIHAARSGAALSGSASTCWDGASTNSRRTCASRSSPNTRASTSGTTS